MVEMNGIMEDQENTNVTPNKRNSQERKSCYRQLLDKVEAIQQTENLGLQTVNELGEVIREANLLDSECVIEDRVGNADETLLDCKVISSASNILRKCIEAVDVFTSTYESTEFSQNIVSFINENEDEIHVDDIKRLIDEARRVIPDVPEYLYVFGTYDLDKVPQPKEKKVRVKAVKEQLQKKHPERIVNRDKDEDSIEEIVKVLHDVLSEEYTKNNEEPVKYYDYIIDTESYANTVENMFYFSFLVRDGRAQIDLDRNGKPIIKPIKKKGLKEFRGGGGVNAQILTVIDMELWQGFKKEGFLQKRRKTSVAS